MAWRDTWRAAGETIGIYEKFQHRMATGEWYYSCVTRGLSIDRPQTGKLIGATLLKYPLQITETTGAVSHDPGF